MNVAQRSIPPSVPTKLVWSCAKQCKPPSSLSRPFTLPTREEETTAVLRAEGGIEIVHEHSRDNPHSQFHTNLASAFARVGLWIFFDDWRATGDKGVQRSGPGSIGGRCVTQRHAWFLRFGRRPECWFAAKFATERSGFLLVGER
jgi:hypothetical protein